MRKHSAEDVMQTVVDLCRKRLPDYYGFSPDQIQVLTPSRRQAAGTQQLNRMLQDALNPPDDAKPEKRYGDTIFRLGDRVMQVRNNYDIVWEKEFDPEEEGTGMFNGDVGKIVGISLRDENLCVQFDDKLAHYTFDIEDKLQHEEGEDRIGDHGLPSVESDGAGDAGRDQQPHHHEHEHLRDVRGLVSPGRGAEHKTALKSGEHDSLGGFIAAAYAECAAADSNEEATTFSGEGLSEKHEALLGTVLTKPQVVRAIVHMFYENDMDAASIAKAVGMSERHVTQQLEALGELNGALESSYKDICTHLHAQDSLKEYAIKTA